MTTSNNVMKSNLTAIFSNESVLSKVVIQTAFLFLNSIEAIVCGINKIKIKKKLKEKGEQMKKKLI